jgi:integrase
MDAHPPRLLDRLRAAIPVRHLSIRTEKTYVEWVRRYILFHGKRHPAEMGKVELEAFLSHLAVARHVSASTQAQALNALLFLYRHVLDVELPWLDEVVRAKRARRLPVVLTPAEVRAVLGVLSGREQIVASLLYGAGLRLLEAMRLRVKDLDFERRELTVREGKGNKDRRVPLPERLRDALER